MGYTHYWENREVINAENWRAIATEAHRLIDATDAALAYESDFPDDAPEINEASIRFNGVGKEGYETFLLTREAIEFEFCKTGREPYDAVVGRLLKFCADTVPSFTWRCDDITGEYNGKKTNWDDNAEDYLTPIK